MLSNACATVAMRGMLRVKPFLSRSQQALRMPQLIRRLRINSIVARSEGTGGKRLHGSKAFQRGVQMGDGVVQIHNTS